MILCLCDLGVPGLRVARRWRPVIIAGPGAIAAGLAAGLAAGFFGSGMGMGAGAAAQHISSLSMADPSNGLLGIAGGSALR